MILGFNLRFVEPIHEGIKIHTIRVDKTKRWKPGIIIHFANGVRTKNYTQFHKGKCISTQAIEIRNVFRKTDFDTYTFVRRDVYIDGRLLSTDEIWQLALNDGFDNPEDFFKWFNQDFKGKIIHWTDFRY